MQVRKGEFDCRLKTSKGLRSTPEGSEAGATLFEQSLYHLTGIGCLNEILRHQKRP